MKTIVNIILILFLGLIIYSQFNVPQREELKSEVKITKPSVHYFQGSKVDSFSLTRLVYDTEKGKKEMKTTSFILSKPTSAYLEHGIVLVISFFLMYFWFYYVKESEKLALRFVSCLILPFVLMLVYLLTLAKFDDTVIQLWTVSILAPATISVLLFITTDNIQRTVRNIFIAFMIILQGIFFVYLKPDATEFFVFSATGTISGILYGLFLLKFFQKRRRKYARK